MRVFQDDGVVMQVYVMQVYFGNALVEQLLLPPLQVSTWTALARQLLPGLSGAVIGSIDPDKTIAGRKDAFVMRFPTVVLDTAAIVERVGIEIDAASIAQFVPDPTRLKHEDWCGACGGLG